MSKLIDRIKQRKKEQETEKATSRQMQLAYETQEKERLKNEQDEAMLLIEKSGALGNLKEVSKMVGFLKAPKLRVYTNIREEWDNDEPPSLISRYGAAYADLSWDRGESDFHVAIHRRISVSATSESLEIRADGFGPKNGWNSTRDLWQNVYGESLTREEILEGDRSKLKEKIENAISEAYIRATEQ